jgi:hypothetical protein
MKPAPITVQMTEKVTLALDTAGDEIVATLRLGSTVVPPIARAVANSERVRTADGALHIGRMAFYIPAEQRAAVRDFIVAAQAIA